jgi:broad specificity phosphatase PhoE
LCLKCLLTTVQHRRKLAFAACHRKLPSIHSKPFLRMRSTLFRLAHTLVFFSSIQCCEAGLKIYYIRHAEGGHNVVSEWNSVPRNKWPAYVGNADLFTPKGEQQVVRATARLATLQFDFIAASPTWRTRHTVLPFLEQTDRQAEIWPELEEFNDVPVPAAGSAAALPRPSRGLFTGASIVIPDGESDFFTLRQGAERSFKLGGSNLQIFVDTQAALNQAIDLIRSRFSGSDKSILLVGHGNSGRRLLSTLLGNRMPPNVVLQNTAIWMVEEQPDHSFALRMLNDQTAAEPARR